MDTLSGRLRELSDRLAEAHVDVGLGAVIAAIEREAVPSRALATAGELLVERAATVKATRDSLKRLRRWVEYTSGVLPFTEAGWPERRTELVTRLESDPAGGVDAWLADAYRALGDGREAAVERLATLSLPPGAEILADRFLTAVAGIKDRRWHLTAPIALAAAGTRAADRLEDDAVRYQLRMLLLRLAIADERDAEADRLQEECAADVRARPAVDALKARRRRRTGDIDGARSLIAGVRGDGSIDLDVTLERIALARLDDLEDLALDAAQAAVAGLPALSDVEATFARLVSDVPAELWVAVADRALAEGEAQVHDLAREAAESGADDGNSWLRAVVAEMQVRSAEGRGAPLKEQAELLVWAGSYRMDAGQVEIAIDHYGQALAKDANNADAALRLADSKIVAADAVPLSQARESLGDALVLIHGVQARPLPSWLSWSFLSEASAHGLLARAADASSEGHRWRSLLAACRSVAHEPDDSARWVEFADRTDQLGLFRAAEVASRRAFSLNAHSDSSLSQRIQSLVNAGDFDGALELLSRVSGAWEDSVRGYILARAGKLLSAVDVLRTAGPDPMWFWVSHTLLLALLLTDRQDEAFREAKTTRQAWAERDDEINGRLAAGWTALILGDFEAAEAASTVIKDLEPDGQGAVLHGCSLLLAGKSEAGIEALSGALSRTRVLALLCEWQSLIYPAVRLLAAHYRVELPSLASLEVAVADRRRALERGVDPIEELRGADGPPDDSLPVQLAKDMGVALLQIAGDDLDGAEKTLKAMLRERPDDPELALLARYVGARRLAAGKASPGELVGELVHMLETGPADGAAAIMRVLVGSPASEWLVQLSSAASGRPELMDALDTVLDRLSDDPVAYEQLGVVRSAVGAPPGLEAATEDYAPDRWIRVLLPRSWFEDYKDPVNDHPLFNRHLPEIRARATFTVPAVNVSVDATLEPDGYVIFIDDIAAETGHVDPGVVYLPPAGLPLLNADLQAAAADVPELELVAVSPELVRESGDLARLLAMTAVEVVARRIADVAHNGPSLALEEPAPQL